MKTENAEEKYQHWLAGVMPFPAWKKRKLTEAGISAKTLYYIEETYFRTLSFLNNKEIERLLESRKTWDIDHEYELMKRKEIRLYTFGSKGYPVKLGPIASPPYAIYVKGELPCEEVLSVGIVGARTCSPYGAEMAARLSKQLAENKVQIISGMARGIDGIAQKTALKSGGSSYGILAGGVDICYPKENFELYLDLISSGGVISEQIPGTKPLSQYFPARNRIISALSDVLIVIEAREKSGSLITVDMALEQGKDVYAVPGPIGSELSRGCNRLIRQGAGIVLSEGDLLEELGIFYKEKMKNQPENKIKLENTEKLVYSRLDLQPKHLSHLAEETGMPVPELINKLIIMEMQGIVREVSKNYYIKIK